MLHAAFEVSDDIDVMAGVRRVAAACRHHLGDRQPQVGILFTSCMDGNFASMLAEVMASFPGIELIGCTTDGEITAAQGFSEDSTALLVLGSETIRFSTSIAEHISSQPSASMRRAFAEARSRLDRDPVCAFVFPDGLTTAAVPLDMHLREAMGADLPVFGGAAGDGFRIQKTYQFYRGRVYSDAMPVLLLAGDVSAAVAVATGVVPYGDYFEVDRSADNKLFSVDNKTALDFYRAHLGRFIEERELAFFPLAVYHDNPDQYVLRDPLTIDPDDGSIEFLGTFPERCRVRMTSVSRDDTLRSADGANRQILQPPDPGPPDLVLIFSCTSRRHILGSRTSEEFAALREPADSALFFGFYCYGEIGPFAVGQPTRFHSDTYIAVALRGGSGEGDG